MKKVAKVGWAIGFFVVLGGGYWLLRPAKEIVPSSVVAVESSSVAKVPQDSDKDGLKDWEEILWQSDPNKADTDSDGTLDGQEVATNRDPGRAGPDDVIKPNSDVASLNTVDTYEYEYDTKLGNTFTDTLSLNLTSNYLLARGQGELSEQDKAALVEAVTLDAAKSLTSPKIFSSSDLYIKATSPSTLRTYFNSLALVIKNNESFAKGEEIAVMDTAMSSKDIKDFAPLKKIGRGYADAAKEILSLPVPQSLSTSHLALANNISQAGWGLELMGNSGADPTQMLVGLGAYRKAYSDLTQSVVPKLTAPIREGKLSFARNEPAYMFIQ